MFVYKSNITEHNNWSIVENEISKIDRPELFVSFCDNYFKNTEKPISTLWYGIIHNPVGWEKYTPWCIKTTLFQTNSFINSLKFCKILFVMAETQIIPILNLLKLTGYKNIKVVNLCHPINNLNCTFNYEKYNLSYNIHGIKNLVN